MSSALSTTILVAALLVAHSGCSRSHRKGEATKTELRQVQATIVSVEPSLESVPYQAVTLRISNHGRGPQIVSGYVISWPGGVLRVDGLAVGVAAAADVVRTVRVSPASGILENLTADTARIAVY